MTREEAIKHLDAWLDERMWRCFGEKDRESIRMAISALKDEPLSHEEAWAEIESDLISRADAAKAITDISEEYETQYPKDKITIHGIARICRVVLASLPSVSADRPHGEWIPVTEQLPKIDEALPLCDQISDEVLGTDTYGNIWHVYLTNCGYLEPTFCTVEEGMSVDIVAWMQLPEPYEEASNGKD